ncbi:MAG: bacillithiol biosynthesis BshC, partial [Deinococcales bacterium]|nr:bacillithiol biosynthesis BshC [Chitinophagaceae bacterium]
MKNISNFIQYSQTGFFSKLVADYVSAAEELKPFYKYPVSIDGIKAAIQSRQSFTTNRQLLVNELTNQYQNIILTDKQVANLDALKSDTTFTITT